MFCDFNIPYPVQGNSKITENSLINLKKILNMLQKCKYQNKIDENIFFINIIYFSYSNKKYIGYKNYYIYNFIFVIFFNYLVGYEAVAFNNTISGKIPNNAVNLI